MASSEAGAHLADLIPIRGPRRNQPIEAPVATVASTTVEPAADRVDHDLLADVVRLHSLRAELAAALAARHPDDIRADIAAVRHRMENR